MKRNEFLSIVVPVYNEESNIGAFYDALKPVLRGIGMGYEVIFVDDGSTDDSFGIIQSLRAKDTNVRAIRFSRNFGSHAALLAGLRWATGDAAVIISVDLQDPPEIIPSLVEKWQEGSHVVWAVRESRKDPFLKKMFATAFYRLFRRIAMPSYPATGMDFGLFDRVVIENLKDYREINYFIIGTIVWLGYRQTYVQYVRRARLSGHSKWSFARRLKNALDAIVSFSFFPIRFISYLGIFISILSFLYAGFLIVGRLFFGLGASGWPSVMVTVLFIGGVQLVMLGVLGEYIWRGTEQSKGRPQYVIMGQVGFKSVRSTKHNSR